MQGIIDLRERLARTMASVLEGGWDAIPHDRKQQRRWTGPLGINTPSRVDFLAAADLLIPEVLSFLSDNGLAIVPVKSTMVMQNAAQDATGAGIEMPWKGLTPQVLHARAYSAMVKAAPPAAELLDRKEETK